MKAEKFFTFLFIVISLIGGVFVMQSRLEDFFLTAQEKTSSLSPQLRDLFENAKSRYSALKELLGELNPGENKNGDTTSGLSSFLLEKIFSPEQRVGQLFIVGIEGTEITSTTQELIKNFYPGGILLLKKNIKSAEQLKKLINDLQTISLEAVGLPLFIAVDQEGGVVDRIDFLKEKTAQSELKTAEHARQVGFQRGRELKELGVNLNLAPLLDETEPGDFVFQRSFQKGAALIGELALALIAGQKEAGVLTAVKHFPGYAGIRFNPEEKLAVLAAVPGITQFEKVIIAEPEFVMTANVLYQGLDPELPFTFSSTSVQFLKENLGEKALLISDDLAQNSLLSQFSLSEIITLPFQAGFDVLLFSGWRTPAAPAISAFREAVRAGTISQEEIDRRVIKIIELKSRL